MKAAYLSLELREYLTSDWPSSPHIEVPVHLTRVLECEFCPLAAPRLLPYKILKPQKSSTCRNATGHDKNALEFLAYNAKLIGIRGATWYWKKKTSHDETDTFDKQPLPKRFYQRVSVWFLPCMVPLPSVNATVWTKCEVKEFRYVKFEYIIYRRSKCLYIKSKQGNKETRKQ